MPRSSRARPLVAACLALAALATLVPQPVAALEPPRPLPGYRPHFVSEVDRPPYRDCLWAAGAMLLDKWTSGETRVDRERLRRLSRDRHGGSALADLRRAYARLGIDLRYSPDGGARITWPILLDRLAHGAGAVLLGDYGDLPRFYGRWDPAFWSNPPDKDNHAVYIERYDRKRGRVWLMDPLGRGDWHGEWISVRDLRRFAWTRGGLVVAALTPKARPAPFAGVELGEPDAVVTETALEVAWPLAAPDGWAFPGADVIADADLLDGADAALRAAAERLVEPVGPVGRVLAVNQLLPGGQLLPGSPSGSQEPLDSAAPGAPPGDAAPAVRPAVAVDGSRLLGTIPLPSTAGAWAVTVTVTDRRFGRPVATTDALAVFVPGARRGRLSVLTDDRPVPARTPIPVSVLVTNSGSRTWADIPLHGAPAEIVPLRATRLVARWIPMSLVDVEGVALSSPAAVALDRVPLEPGQAVVVDAELLTPSAAGTWALVVDLVDDVDGSFALHGSAPGIRVLQVTDPPTLSSPR